MPSKKKTAEPGAEPFEVDPRSAKVVLHYVGENDRSARNAPPRDLTESDLARLAYVERIREIGSDVGQPIDREDPDSELIARPDPRDPDPVLVGAIVADLVASGRFSLDLPEPAKPDSPTPEPVKPADEPEG